MKLIMSERHWTTAHPKVRVTHFGLGNYRTEVLESNWYHITGPAWPTAQAARDSVDADFVWVHFGEGKHVVQHPIRGLVEEVRPDGIIISTTEAVGEIGVGERVIISVVTT